MAEKVRVRKLTDKGRTTGYEIDYKDGRQAAVVRPATVKVTTKVNR